MSELDGNVLIEAKTLRATLKALRSHIEQIVKGETHVPLSTVYDKPYKQNDHVTSIEKVIVDTTQGDTENHKSIQAAVDRSVSNFASPTTIIRRRGLIPIRQSSVAIIGGMQVNGKGLSSAETLVRCGVKRLILFDLEDDASTSIELAQHRWESEENPYLELETYVSAYSLDEDTFEHFSDRLAHGGDNQSPVQLVILAPFTSASNIEVRNLILRGASGAGCRVLGLKEDLTMAILDPSGHEIIINEPGLTLGNMALELLLTNI